LPKSEPKTDSYLTLAAPCEGIFRDRGSKFLAYVSPVPTEEKAMEYLEEVRKLHPKGRHHCFAFRFGVNGEHFRANDDGEPSGTAGKPILGQLVKNELSDVMAVVVRYFGGTLLGTSGLITAYKESTAEAIKNGIIREKVISDAFKISFDYILMPMVMEGVKKLELEILRQEFSASPFLEINIRKSEVAGTIPRLKSLITGRPVEEIKDKKIENLKIEKMDD
jgi:uncharacterized YigZ family protein